MASLTGVGDTVTLQMTHRGDQADVAISGTYEMILELQVEAGSPGSGAWTPIKTWDAHDDTIAFSYRANADNESLRVIVTEDTDGTATVTLTDTTDLLLLESFDSLGNTRVKWYQEGPVFYNADGDVLADLRQDQKVVQLTNANATILAANSGKIHSVPNVSADRTFTLPAVEAGLDFTFVAEVGDADGHDWIFAIPDGLFLGGVLMIDTDESPATAAAVVADQSDDDAFQVNVPQGGTWVRMYCNGTNWIVSGVVNSTAAAVFS